jgi:hypothetical protein
MCDGPALQRVQRGNSLLRLQAGDNVEANPNDFSLESSGGGGGSSSGANGRPERHVSEVHITIGQSIQERLAPEDTLQSTMSPSALHSPVAPLDSIPENKAHLRCAAVRSSSQNCSRGNREGDSDVLEMLLPGQSGVFEMPPHEASTSSSSVSWGGSGVGVRPISRMGGGAAGPPPAGRRGAGGVHAAVVDGVYHTSMDSSAIAALPVLTSAFHAVPVADNADAVRTGLHRYMMDQKGAGSEGGGPPAGVNSPRMPVPLTMGSEPACSLGEEDVGAYNAGQQARRHLMHPPLAPGELSKDGCTGSEAMSLAPRTRSSGPHSMASPFDADPSLRHIRSQAPTTDARSAAHGALVSTRDLWPRAGPSAPAFRQIASSASTESHINSWSRHMYSRTGTTSSIEGGAPTSSAPHLASPFDAQQPGLSSLFNPDGSAKMQHHHSSRRTRQGHTATPASALIPLTSAFEVPSGQPAPSVHAMPSPFGAQAAARRVTAPAAPDLASPFDSQPPSAAASLGQGVALARGARRSNPEAPALASPFDREPPVATLSSDRFLDTFSSSNSLVQHAAGAAAAARQPVQMMYNTATAAVEPGERRLPHLISRVDTQLANPRPSSRVEDGQGASTSSWVHHQSEVGVSPVQSSRLFSEGAPGALRSSLIMHHHREDASSSSVAGTPPSPLVRASVPA